MNRTDVARVGETIWRRLEINSTFGLILRVEKVAPEFAAACECESRPQRHLIISLRGLGSGLQAAYSGDSSNTSRRAVDEGGSSSPCRVHQDQKSTDRPLGYRHRS